MRFVLKTSIDQNKKDPFSWTEFKVWIATIIPPTSNNKGIATKRHKEFIYIWHNIEFDITQLTDVGNEPFLLIFRKRQDFDFDQGKHNCTWGHRIFIDRKYPARQREWKNRDTQSWIQTLGSLWNSEYRTWRKRYACHF